MPEEVNPPVDETLAEIERALRVRARIAYLLMALFVIATSLGVFLIHVGGGFIALGVTSGIVGFLIGND